jgi:hypothetical protein
LEEGAHHKYLGRAKAPVEALASLVAEDCSIAAAAVVAVVALAVAGADVAAAGVVVVAVAAALVVAVELAAAVEPVAAEAQESGDFVADHHFRQTWPWEMGEG